MKKRTSAYDEAMGNAAMALVYSGEAAYAMELNDDLSYSVPEEGSNLWIDSWVIPKNAKHKENAEAFINYMQKNFWIFSAGKTLAC